MFIDISLSDDQSGGEGQVDYHPSIFISYMVYSSRGEAKNEIGFDASYLFGT